MVLFMRTKKEQIEYIYSMSEIYKKSKRKNVKMFSTTVACATTVTVVTFAVLSNFAGENGLTNIPSTEITTSATEPSNNNNPEKPIITGIDSIDSPFGDAAVVGNPNWIYKDNISPLLLTEMEKHGDKAEYKVVIKGNPMNAIDFETFRYEGKTFSEYAEIAIEARERASDNWNVVSEDEYDEMLTIASVADEKQHELWLAYQVYFAEKYGDMYTYLDSAYSFTDSQSPVDLTSGILCEDYNMLAVASEQTIIDLANARYTIALGAEPLRENLTRNAPDENMIIVDERFLELWEQDTAYVQICISYDEEAFQAIADDPKYTTANPDYIANGIALNEERSRRIFEFFYSYRKPIEEDYGLGSESNVGVSIIATVDLELLRQLIADERIEEIRFFGSSEVSGNVFGNFG
jgi:hypothetical protein